jgi:hypothetical protein
VIVPASQGSPITNRDAFSYLGLCVRSQGRAVDVFGIGLNYLLTEVLDTLSQSDHRYGNDPCFEEHLHLGDDPERVSHLDLYLPLRSR